MNIKELKEPAYNLDTIKTIFKQVSQLNMTYSAMQGQYKLGFSDEEVIEVVQSLTRTDFYKSILSNHIDFAEWQDVYRPIFKGIDLYVKFQMNKKGHMIISFKER